MLVISIQHRPYAVAVIRDAEVLAEKSLYIEEMIMPTVYAHNRISVCEETSSSRPQPQTLIQCALSSP